METRDIEEARKAWDVIMNETPLTHTKISHHSDGSFTLDAVAPARLNIVDVAGGIATARNDNPVPTLIMDWDTDSDEILWVSGDSNGK